MRGGDYEDVSIYNQGRTWYACKAGWINPSVSKRVNKENRGNLKKLFSVVSINIQYQDTVTVTIEGTDEDVAAEEMLAFFEENL